MASKEYYVEAWFLVEAEDEHSAYEKVKASVIGGRPSLGEIEDWDVSDIEEKKPEAHDV